MGTAIKERTVVNAVQAEAKAASSPYFNAKIEVVAPAGMAVRITDTLRTKTSTFSRLHTRRTASGSSTNRTAEKYSVSRWCNRSIFISATMLPTRIMDNAVLHTPMAFRLSVTKAGNGTLNSIKPIPISTAAIHGCVKTFSKKIFHFSEQKRQSQRPHDHSQGNQKHSCKQCSICSKMPSAMGVPRIPEFEQIVAYCITG